MNKLKITQLLQASIHLELQIAEIYKRYYEIYDQDKNFWWQLVIEEQAHAALLRSGKEHYLPSNNFPEKIISHSLARIEDSNARIDFFLKDMEEKTPSREVAFSTAYYFEEMIGELNFQLFMTKIPESKLESIFQHLNVDSIDHAKRIHDYMESNGIALLDFSEVIKE